MTNTDKRITQEPEINTQFSHLIQLVWIAQSTRLVMLWITFMIAVVIAETREPKDEQFFINHIFQKYGDREVLTFEVREIKNKWRIGTKGEIGDDGDLNSYGLVIPSAFLAFIVGFPDVGEASKGFEHLLANLGLGRLNFEETHDVSIHKINGSFIELHDQQALHRHEHLRKKRHAPVQLKPAHKDKTEVCLSPQEILESYGLEPNHGVIISHDGFQHLCPAIIYELDQKHCWDVHHHAPESRSTNIVWLEASISILIMSIAGLLCAAIVPILNRTKGDELLHFLVAVAAGTLAGDALIHLLPQALNYNPETEHKTIPLLRATVTLLSILLLYIIESVFRFMLVKKQDKGSKHPEEGNMLKHSHHNADKGPLACIVIAGDVLHNVTDGLSVGAAFSVSRGAGLACATAVFCHELPHELGDYAVLLKEGMSVRRALCCNLFSSVFSFGGMGLGLLLGEVLDAAPWVNAFTAGSFIYIALGTLVPELKTRCGLGAIFCQVIGLTSGIILMFFIGMFEEDWEHFLTS